MITLHKLLLLLLVLLLIVSLFFNKSIPMFVSGSLSPPTSASKFILESQNITSMILFKPESASFINVAKQLFVVGENDPLALFYILNSTDVFEIKMKDPQLFNCTNKHFQVKYNKQNVENYRLRRNGSYIFYQHVHKAGGTSFCYQAHENTINSSTCHNIAYCHLGTPPWNRKETVIPITKSLSNHVLMNEFDVFYEYFFDYEDAVFATTLRDPIDRIYSHYNYEHAQGRDKSDVKLSFIEWWKFYSNILGHNYLINTFEGSVDVDRVKADESSKALKSYLYIGFRKGENLTEHLKCKYWTYEKFIDKPMTWDRFKRAVNNLKRFSLLLILEWLNTEANYLYTRNILGWRQKVKAVNVRQKLEEFSSQDYIEVAKYNVFDILFYQLVRRMAAERMRCT